MKGCLVRSSTLSARSYSSRVSPQQVAQVVLGARKHDVHQEQLSNVKNHISERKKPGSPIFDRRAGDRAKLLYERYNPGYSSVAASRLGNANYFFNAAEVTYEWSASSFWDIPGEKLKARVEQQVLNQEPATDHGENSRPKNVSTARKYPGKTDGIPFELLNGLPEVAFLGRCNAGKSTLLNNMTTEFSKIKLDEYAKTSKKAGFTKTINCFNVGRRFRLIDTPGYGVKGTFEQGELIMRYLRERKELKRVYLLISAEQGFTETDSQIVEFLTKFGIPYEIVFTKLDKVSNLSRLHQVIEDSGVLELPTMPRMLFLNSITNSQCPKRLGISSLRDSILESCGLEQAVKPLKFKSKRQ
ncbi:LAFA_0G18162g1_1 [Lachancea sp. 'fantastica']|nr:LAFA_0G18162g1_1 [Lachancea sp. 'fantastica']